MGVDAAAHEGRARRWRADRRGARVRRRRAYPASRRRLHAPDRATGAVVSELPPGFTARRWCFPARNRIIAALRRVVVVVEGGERSGSLITARLAAELGREVGAVPGRVTSPARRDERAARRRRPPRVRGRRTSSTSCSARRAARSGPATRADLDPISAAVLEAVAGGRRHLHRLVGAGHDPGRRRRRWRPELRVLVPRAPQRIRRGVLRRAPVKAADARNYPRRHAVPRVPDASPARTPVAGPASRPISRPSPRAGGTG